MNITYNGRKFKQDSIIFHEENATDRFFKIINLMENTNCISTLKMKFFAVQQKNIFVNIYKHFRFYPFSPPKFLFQNR